MATPISNAQLLLLVTNYLKRTEGRIRLQKIVFLLKERDRIPITYRFAPYLYGPYSSDLQNEINILTRANFLKAFKVNNTYIYEITPLGEQTASEIIEIYDHERAKELEEKVRNYADFTTEELVNWSKEIMGKNHW